MRSVVIYGGLLAVAMVGAYVSWTSDSATSNADENNEGIAVYSARDGDVKKIAFAGPVLDVQVERRSDERGEYIWVTVDETREKKLPPKPHAHEDGEEHGEDGDEAPKDGSEGTPDDAATPEGPEAAPEPEPEVEIEKIHKEFLGGERATGLLSTYEPLEALRELQPTSEDLSSFELDSPEAKLVVTKSGGETVIDLGGETYGSRKRYARYNDRVFLLDDTAVRPIQFAATRLKEIRLHPFVSKDLDAVRVDYKGQKIGLVQKNKDDKAASFWVRQDDPETKDEQVGIWLDTVLKLKVADYPTEPLVGATPKVGFAFTSGSDTWTVTLIEDGEGKLFAQSNFNRAVVAIPTSLANEALADLDSLFAE